MIGSTVCGFWGFESFVGLDLRTHRGRSASLLVDLPVMRSHNAASDMASPSASPLRAKAVFSFPLMTPGGCLVGALDRGLTFWADRWVDALLLLNLTDLRGGDLFATKLTCRRVELSCLSSLAFLM
jgi:hypothetical protein